MLTRRDVLTWFLGAPVALAACRLPRPGVECRFVGGGALNGHLARDTASLPEVSAERVQRVQVAVVGAGASGLVTAWALRRAGVRDVLVLEAERWPGGTSSFGHTPVTDYPYGAHYVPVPAASHRGLVTLLTEMGALDGVDERGHPRGVEHMLVRAPEERLFIHGRWQPGLWPRSGATAEDARQFQAFHAQVERLSGLTDGRGRRAFALPLAEASDDPEFTALDRISMAQWMDQQGFTSPRLRWFVDYACRDDYGALLPHTSAWSALFYYAARQSLGGESAPFLSWPEGNGRILRHLLQTTGDALRLGHVVLDVHQDDSSASLVAATDAGAVRVVAERVVVAVPRTATRYIVRAWRRAPPVFLAGFRYGSWLSANLHLRTRPVGPGPEVAWDNVLFDSPALGYVVATHQRGPDAGPTVWTWYMAMTDPDVVGARRALLAMSAEDAADVVLADLRRAHPDIDKHVDYVELFRHGHAMVRPDVGFLWGPLRRAAAQPLGRLHFAHADLGGLPLFEEALDQGLRAADEVLAALGRPVTGLR